ncbi:hypothetical protein Peur_037034 [Populus x canadensis]
MPHQLLARGFVGLHMCCPIFLCFSQFFSLQEFARYILYVCLISILKPCREEVKRWGMELKAKGVLCMEILTIVVCGWSIIKIHMQMHGRRC